MIKALNDLCYNRASEILEELQATNEYYSHSINSIAIIKENLSSKINNNATITLTLTKEDIDDLRNYFEYIDMIIDLHKKELHKGGFIDCITMLKTIGIL